MQRSTSAILALAAIPLLFVGAGLAARRGGAALQQQFHGAVAPSRMQDNSTPTDPRVQVTNGIRHTVPLAEIVNGGPPRDGIPSIDAPKFVSPAAAAEFLRDDDVGISFVRGDDARFYPFQILVWHEIVNDVVGGSRVLVTYCPLCASGIVFDPRVGDARVEFGTSGKLWNSNLVLYDRKTQSLWSQVLGEAIVGEMAGARLPVLPSDIMRFGEWRRAYPQGKVLSRDTGARRPYGTNPYGNYATSPGVAFPLSARSDTFREKDIVLGVVVHGKAKAYLQRAVRERGKIEDKFAGTTIVAKYDPSLGTVRLFMQQKGGALERLPAIPTFWFSWFAAHPQTETYPSPGEGTAVGAAMQ